MEINDLKVLQPESGWNGELFSCSKFMMIIDEYVCLQDYEVWL